MAEYYKRLWVYFRIKFEVKRVFGGCVLTVLQAPLWAVAQKLRSLSPFKINEWLIN